MDFQLNEEQQMWKNVVHNFVKEEIKPYAAEYNEKAEMNWDAIHKMGAVGMLGMSVAEEYGGSELDAISAAIAIEEIAWGDGGTALTLEAHNELGCAPVAKFGTREQKEKFLPSVTSGKGGLTALALTEPQAGSDLRNVQTKAKRQGAEWVLNGTKMWITNAGAAEFIITLAKTSSEEGSHNMSMFIVPTDTPGLHIAPPEKKMGAGCTHSHEVRYEDVHIPDDYLLGEEGRGLHQTLHTLDGGRVSIAALSVGIAQAA
ncbi:MAG: acyl-CoA dehydrogenase family protein, partial [Chloroflexota bacterium]|nr:acyl-CoA dehydrogenase family protein [Chloroflexota bacterium]